MSLKRIEIPFGISNEGKSVSIPVGSTGRNHCFITGSCGVGKSTLLMVIIDSIERNCDRTEAVVWTDFFNRNYIKCPYDSIMEVRTQGMNHRERMISLFNSLYEEAEKRESLLNRNGVRDYNKVESMPLIIAIIDNFRLFDLFDYEMKNFEDTLRISHVVGISVVCTSQSTISQICASKGYFDYFFNVRIALHTCPDYIFDTLDLKPSIASPELIEDINDLSSCRERGKFLYHNRFAPKTFVAGRVVR